MSQQENAMKLDKVTVFQSNALFKMLGTYKCHKGENTIKIDQITHLMDKNSFRIKGKGPGKIANIIIEKGFLEEVNEEKIKVLKDKREKLEKELRISTDNLSVITTAKNKQLEAQTNFVSSYPKYFSLGKIELSKIEEMNRLFEKELSNSNQEIRKLEDTIDDVKKKIDIINKQINQIGYNSSSEENSYYTITVIIEAIDQATFNLEASFMVQNAYWEPFYDILILEDRVEVDLMANVYNNTNVDWQDVQLDISTASVKPVKMDKPEPYNIDEYRPVYPSRPSMAPRRAIMRERAKPAMDFVAQSIISEESYLEPPSPPEAEPDITTVEADVNSNFGVEIYSLKTRYNVISDKNPKPIPLFKEELTSITQYFWSVVSPDRVLCNNKIQNKSHLILPGSAKVYVGDEFIGETLLDLIAPNEKFKLGERISYDIKVKKELKAKQKQKEGAFKGKNLTSYKYQLTIENLKNVEEELIIYDRIPHSVSEKVKVKITQISPEPANNTMNVLKWVIKMAEVKEKLLITYEYEVVTEKDVNVHPPLP